MRTMRCSFIPCFAVDSDRPTDRHSTAELFSFYRATNLLVAVQRWWVTLQNALPQFSSSLCTTRGVPLFAQAVSTYLQCTLSGLSLSLGLHSRSVPVDEQGGKKEGRQQGAIERGGNERARAAPMHDHLRFPVITSSLSLSLAPSPRRPESEKPLSLPPSASRCPIFVFAAAVASPQSPKLNLATLQKLCS